MNNSAVVYQLLDYLKGCGVEVLYGVTGDAIFPLLSAIGEQDEIAFIGTTHEVNAAFMASCQAKLTGKPGVCIATSGPGIANLVNGLAEAYFEKTPVLVIAGQVGLKKVGTRAKQYVNQQSLLQAVTDSSELITDGEAVIPAVAQALSRTVNFRTVNHVSIPRDVFTQTVKGNNVPAVQPGPEKGGKGLSGKLEEAVSMLQSAQKVLIVVGERIERELVNELAEKVNGALVIAQQAKGVIPDSHPGVVGGLGQAYVPQLINEADCLFIIGSASFEKKFLPRNLNTIQVTDNLENIDYQNVKVSLSGEVNQVLYELVNRIEKKDLQQEEHKTWRNKIEQEKAQLNSLINKQLQNKSNPIHPAHLMTVLGKTIDNDAYVHCDIGSFIHWFDTYFQATDQIINVSTYWRSMGSALPGGLSTCLHYPDRQSIVLTGDGGLLMSLSELATAVKYQLPVKVVVVNNQQYQLEKSRMEKGGMTPYGYDLHVPDFASVAESFRVKGIRVDDVQMLEKNLQDGLNIEAPVVLDIQVSQIPLPTPV